jgi:hypothetical protein
MYLKNKQKGKSVLVGNGGPPLLPWYTWLTSATKGLQQHSHHHKHSNEQKHRSDLQECKFSSFFIHQKGVLLAQT